MRKKRPVPVEVNGSEPSDSDEDYTENEKQLLANLHNKQKYDSENEVEVFSVGGNENDSEDDHSDIALSDIDDQHGDDLPDIRAWGKHKKSFYNTDYVDPGFGEVQGKNAHLAELEEEDATNLQQLLTHELDDFVEILSKHGGIDTKVPGTVDASLTKIQEKESPEFYGIIEEFKDYFGIAKDLSPVVDNYKQGRLDSSPLVDFILTQHELILLYCTNICTYLLLKSSQSNVQNHPVLRRLFQFNQLLSKMAPIYEEIIKPQIESLLQSVMLKNMSPVKNKQILKILSQLNNKTYQKSKQVTKEASKVKGKPDILKDENDQMGVTEDDDGSTYDSAANETPGADMGNATEEMDTQFEINDASVKRGITYQMAKNKGLTPYRKKELRNPRVKHRNKYRKAKIRRKGAVREPRSELTRYSGEISGIKMSVTKSIKIKT